MINLNERVSALNECIKASSLGIDVKVNTHFLEGYKEVCVILREVEDWLAEHEQATEDIREYTKGVKECNDFFGKE